MHEDIRRLTAPSDRSLYLWFEPWGDGRQIPAGCEVEVRARSSVRGELELDVADDRTVVYAWPGSTLEIFVNGKWADAFDVAFPSTPPGMSTKEFTSMMFGGPPRPEADQDLGPKKSRLFRFPLMSRLFRRK